MEQEYRYMVCTSCMTYNHAPYIVDAMNGFTMQETNFPVITLIVDDASTDGEQEVIKQYLADHFQSPYRKEETEDYHLICANHNTNPNCTFVVFLLKYNHYSIKKSKFPYLTEWLDNAKYHALCEGDDYWITANKLQKQVEFIENHADCSLVWTQARYYSEKRNEFIETDPPFSVDSYSPVKYVILIGSGGIPTCSILYKPSLKNKYPDYCVKCHVGDYPLFIMAAMKGRVYYMALPMVVYRKEVANSWNTRVKDTPFENKLAGIISEVRMLEGFSKDYPQYDMYFLRKVSITINYNIPSKQKCYLEWKKYTEIFKSELQGQNLMDKFERYIAQYRIPCILWRYRKWRNRIILRKS